MDNAGNGRGNGRAPRGRGNGRAPRGRGNGRAPRGRGNGRAPRGRGNGQAPRGRGNGQAPRGRRLGQPLGVRERMVVIEVENEQIPLEFQRGDDIVSGLNNYAQERGRISMDISNGLGVVSEFRLQGRRRRRYVGNYQIQSLRGRWLNNGDRFTVTIVLRDMNSGRVINGRSSFMIAASLVTVYVEA